MNFDLTSPCDDCPFRTDHPISLRPGRMQRILDAVLRQDCTFSCHKTTYGQKHETSHCAGALIMLEKSGRPNWRIRFAQGLGLFDPSKLNFESPVGKELDSISAHNIVDI